MPHSWPRIVAHADMDAFYAAVEQLDDPSLRGKPVLVGGHSDRGVVLTASYEARPFGVGSAMPMARARKLCPQAVIVPPRFTRYQAVSECIMDVFEDFSPQVEALSLDEAFLEMTGAGHIFGEPAAMGRRLKAAVREATNGLTVSVGISATKYVAKVASAHDKPDGLTIVAPDRAQDWLAPLPVARLWGAGPKTQQRLKALGLRTIGDLARAGLDFLETHLGSAGLHFHELAHARDPRPVARRRRAQSIGSDRTLAQDVSTHDAAIQVHLQRSADAIARRLRRKGYRARGARVKLKTSDFQLLTRQRQLPEATDVAGVLYAAGVSLLKEFSRPGPFRLVGMAAYDLVRDTELQQLDLFDGDERRRQRQLETTLDDITERFGPGVVRRANALADGTGVGIAPTLDFLDEDTHEN
ncbi:MAG: DNA polymerase IV [Gammaproteobacteria bacterium]|nr:DNA polymerase IV [Gammaproteobacteria bacterium]